MLLIGLSRGRIVGFCGETAEFPLGTEVVLDQRHIVSELPRIDEL